MDKGGKGRKGSISAAREVPFVATAAMKPKNPLKLNCDRTQSQSQTIYGMSFLCMQTLADLYIYTL